MYQLSDNTQFFSNTCINFQTIIQTNVSLSESNRLSSNEVKQSENIDNTHYNTKIVRQIPLQVT